MGLLGFLGLETPLPAKGTDTNRVSIDEDESETMRRIVRTLKALPADQARYLAAFAYVLGRVAHADSHFSDEETRKMQEIVQRLGNLPEAQALLVVEIAKNEVRLFGGTDNYLVTRRFKEMATPRQRTELLDCLFAVVASDESITALEEGQARQISKELGLTHDEFIAARATYLKHLEALKGLRGLKA